MKLSIIRTMHMQVWTNFFTHHSISDAPCLRGTLSIVWYYCYNMRITSRGSPMVDLKPNMGNKYNFTKIFQFSVHHLSRMRFALSCSKRIDFLHQGQVLRNKYITHIHLFATKIGFKKLTIRSRSLVGVLEIDLLFNLDSMKKMFFWIYFLLQCNHLDY